MTRSREELLEEERRGEGTGKKGPLSRVSDGRNPNNAESEFYDSI
jgi:hypothetical protein